MQGGAQEKTQPTVARETRLLHSTLSRSRRVPLSEEKEMQRLGEEGNGLPSINDTTALCVCDTARILDAGVSVHKGLYSVGDDTMDAFSTHLCPQDWPSPDTCSVLQKR